MSRAVRTTQQIAEAVRTASGPVVVGYEHSEEADNALRFAAALAVQREVPLHIVSAYTIVVSDLGLGAGAPWDAEMVDSIRDLAERDAAAAADQVRAEHRGLDVEVVVRAGPAAGVVLEHSRDASLVVLGRHGRTGFVGKLLGGTSRQVATHCAAPTVIVRRPRAAGDTVVVGIDGSPDSVRALAFAFDMASRNGWGLLAVHTWDVPPIGAITGVPSPEPPEIVREMANNEARAALEELAGFGDVFPDVAVAHKIVRGSAVKVLVAEAAEAALLVVGSRGRGGFAGLLLGSVSHGVLDHATCNVAVVRTQ